MMSGHYTNLREPNERKTVNSSTTTVGLLNGETTRLTKKYTLGLCLREKYFPARRKGTLRAQAMVQRAGGATEILVRDRISTFPTRVRPHKGRSPSNKARIRGGGGGGCPPPETGGGTHPQRGGGRV